MKYQTSVVTLQSYEAFLAASVVKNSCFSVHHISSCFHNPFATDHQALKMTNVTGFSGDVCFSILTPFIRSIKHAVVVAGCACFTQFCIAETSGFLVESLRPVKKNDVLLDQMFPAAKTAFIYYNRSVFTVILRVL